MDVKLRKNGPAQAPDLPAILHGDVAGVVEQVGKGVLNFAPGDEVFGCAGGLRGLSGALAEYMSADARLLARKPSNLSMREAAALPLVSLTAWEALVDQAKVAPGQTVLVQGGAGGVGHIAVQLARWRGAKVYATVSTAEKAELVRELGGEPIFYRQEKVEEYVARATGGRGFDVVFDTIGGKSLDQSMIAARRYGSVVSCQSAGLGSHDLMQGHSKALSIHCIFMLLPMMTGEGREHHGEILRVVSDLAERGWLRPKLDPVNFDMTQINEAHERLLSGKTIGKVAVNGFE